MKLTTRQAALLRSLPRDEFFALPESALDNPQVALELWHAELFECTRCGWRLTPAGQAAWDELNKEQCDGER